MTPEEISRRTEDKVTEIKTLCAKLQIVLQAEEVLLKDGRMRHVVYFIDNEVYPKNETA